MSDNKTFTLHIDTDNAAFQPNPARELASILRVIADRLDTVRGPDYQHLDYANGGWIGHFQTIHDCNGNDVGRYALKPSTEVHPKPSVTRRRRR